MTQNESKHDKFKRIATRRVRRIIRTIESLGNLSRPSYEYTNEEVAKIFTTLQETLDNAKALFAGKRTEPKKFEL